MVWIQLGRIQSGGWSDNVGVFSGQNIQNSWDSHTPSASAYCTLMGDANSASCTVCWMWDASIFSQPTFDSDVKGNLSAHFMA
ncbi:MAG: hypothetical protein IRZ33_08745 [Alicyclobacillaceae bacterium]|nr:hypothetical protein [Alicyclobacillaceae bacterium]